MQTKTSYRALKWTCLAAIVTSLATACVVSSGDGNGDDTDIDDGGGSSGEASGGKSGSSTGGTSGKGGTSAGSTSGGTSTGGAGGDGGEGGEAYVAGLCQAELGTMTPSDLPSCDPTDKDEADACLKCMKANCCEDWQLCYGSAPTDACGWGPTSPDDLGQFDCIQRCYVATADGVMTDEEVLEGCQSECLNQCEETDEGFPTDATTGLMGCTHDMCLDECYPVP